MRPPPLIERAAALARAQGWTIERLSADGIALRLPDGTHLALLRRHAPAAGWTVLSAITVPDVPARGGADLASAIAELFAARGLWPLHQAADGALHLVDQDAEDAA